MAVVSPLPVPTGHTQQDLQSVQDYIGYRFARTSFLNEALTAAGVDENNHEGNRRLAMLGEAFIKAAVMLSAYRAGTTRESAAARLETLNSKRRRAAVAKLLGIDQYIQCCPLQNGAPPSTAVLSYALCAIIGAVVLDSGPNITEICQVLESMRIVDQENPCVAPSVISSKERGTDQGSRLQESEIDASSDAMSIHSVEGARIQELSPVTETSSAAFQSTMDIQWAEAHGSEMTLPEFFDASFPPPTQGIYEIDVQQPINILDDALFNVQRDSVGVHVDETYSLSLMATLLELPPLEPPPQNRLCIEQSGANNNILETQDGRTIDGRSEKKRKIHQYAFAQDTSPSIEISDEPSAKKPRVRKCTSRTVDAPPSERTLEKRLEFEIERFQSYNSQNPRDKEAFYYLLTTPELPQLSSRGHTATLQTLYYTIASPESILYLQRVLRSYRDGRSVIHAVLQNPSDKPGQMRVIENCDTDVAFLGLARRYKIIKLFKDGMLGKFVVDTPESLLGKKGRTAGNPNNVAKANQKTNITKQLYPEIGEDNPLYKEKHTLVTNCQNLACRLDILIERFGIGLLALIPTAECTSRNGVNLSVPDKKLQKIPEGAIENFVNLLDKHQGNIIRQLSQAIGKLVEQICQGTLAPQHRLYLEDVDASEVLQYFKGSPRLLELLQPGAQLGELSGLATPGNSFQHYPGAVL